MVEPIANFPQVKMKEFAGYAAIRIEPMFGIAPEPFDTVDMVSPLRTTGFLAHHDVVTAYGQGRISLPLVRVVQAPWPGMPTHQADDTAAAATAHREDLDLSIAFEDPEDDDLAGRAPAPSAFPAAAKGGFVTFHGPFERLPQMFHVGTAGPCEPIEPLRGLETRRAAESLPEYRHAQDKPFEQLTFTAFAQAAGLPDIAQSVALAAAFAFVPSITQLPAARMMTFRASFHRQTSL